MIQGRQKATLDPSIDNTDCREYRRAEERGSYVTFCLEVIQELTAGWRKEKQRVALKDDLR